jgi:hypothetical protein
VPFFLRCEGKAELKMIIFISVNGVLRQCAASPSVYSSYAMDIEVNVQVDESSPVDVFWMTG